MNYTIMELHGMKISMKLQQKDWLVKLYIPVVLLITLTFSSCLPRSNGNHYIAINYIKELSHYINRYPASLSINFESPQFFCCFFAVCRS